ncbi:MAG: GH39 family glycosyl hydrolase [Anaerolineae bacterium]
MSLITIDFHKVISPVKPMHCINNGPIHGTSEKMFHYLQEAGIPFARLHDTGGRYGGSVFVDIENIFRDFSADPADPAAYDFSFTDWLLATLEINGTEPFYRLGATIENSHRIRAYHIFPPKDNLKWAKICEGIIRHYNEGWANGYRYGIKYWEIWNEADNEPDITDNPMWKGTKEQYFALYETAANYLKSKFPELKIGGYASCGFYAIIESGIDNKPHATPREQYFVDFFIAFMDYITSPGHKCPLDFFSWHSYSGIKETVQYAAYARKTLDAYGFTHTESILNEWNPGIAYRGKLRDAAHILAMMCALQASSVDMLMYYDGQVDTTYGGMFNPLTNQPFAAYYVFKAFNELYQLKSAVQSSSDDGEVFVCAASNGSASDVLIVNSGASSKQVEVQFTGGTPKIFDVYTIDETHNLELTGQAKPGDLLTLPGYVTFLLKAAA